MHSHARLRELFKTLATLTVAPVALVGCGDSTVITPPADSGADRDAPADTSTLDTATPADVSADLGVPSDTASDARVDASADASVDASVDAAVDTGADARADSGVDATADSGVDSGADAAADVSADVRADAIADGGSFDTELCAAGTAYAPLVGVTPGMAVDYLELRTQYDEPGSSMVIASAQRGTPCATATDAARCRTELADARATGWSRPSVGLKRPNTEYLVFTVGDRVGTVTSLEALSTFVSPVENPNDAALLAVVRGHRIVCGTRNARAVSGGFEIETQTGHTCGATAGLDQNRVRVETSGGFSIVLTTRIADGDPGCAVGRRPEGLAPVRHAHADALGSYFAAVAHLEAASVYAFDRLARELECHGAPAGLVRDALRAKDDEVKHARVTARLARRFGASTVAPRVASLDTRGLFEIAAENAVEGCVRETFGALVATVQSQRAKDPSVASAMAVIAEDETRHAALAWDVAAWVLARLSDDERARVMKAQREAIATLRREVNAPPAPELVAQAGVPTAAEAAGLLDALAPSLWDA